MPDPVIINDPGQAENIEREPEKFIAKKWKQEIQQRMTPACINIMHQCRVPLQDSLDHRPNV